MRHARREQERRRRHFGVGVRVREDGVAEVILQECDFDGAEVWVLEIYGFGVVDGMVLFTERGQDECQEDELVQGPVASSVGLGFAGVYEAVGEVSETKTYALGERDCVGWGHFVLDDKGEGGGEGGCDELVSPRFVLGGDFL